ncbi:TPA: hypothetical protein SIA33_004433 [Aeromonas salmonicida]|nr:hypothetical protein [Aeromonas salmonicida]
MQLLYEDFQNSKKKPFAQDFFGTDFIKRAEVTISNAVENKKFPHAIDGQCVAAIIAAGIFE